MQVTMDKRNRLGVFLYKADRPTSKFFCPNCRHFIAELAGSEVKAITDVVSDPVGVSIRCSGSVEPGVKCHLWLTFYLGEAK